MSSPKIVTAEEWAKAREELLVAEKEATRALDRLAARRRTLGMVPFPSSTFTSLDDNQPKSLADLFEGQQTLAIYQFMHSPEVGFCKGCTHFAQGVPEAALARLGLRGMAFAIACEAPAEDIKKYRQEQQWEHVPFVSSAGTSFLKDTGAGGGFLLSVFFKDGEDIYRTYTTSSRGIDRLCWDNSLLDLAPWGRQEEWEVSPEGFPQHPTYG